jgi:hypothetical protein
MAPVDNVPIMENVSGNDVGLSYDFGPSGLEFATPVTIRIPFTETPENAGFTVFNVFWYDPNISDWSEAGILNPATKSDDGTYLEVQVEHFSIFAAAGSTASGGGGGDGGCVLSPNGGGNPFEYFLPFGICIGFVWVYRYREYRKRRCLK